MTMASQMSANATTNVTNNSTTNTIGSNGSNDREEQTVKELNGNNETNSSVGANNLRGADVCKRKKLKSRNIPTTSSDSYSKDHLNAWLETCLKDVSQEQLSSSSEFLDYNPTNSASKTAVKQKQNIISGSVLTNPNHINQRQQQSFLNTTNPHQQQNLQQPPMFTNMRNNVKGGHFGFQRSMPNFLKSPGGNSYPTNRFSNMFPSAAGNFYGPHNDSSQEFASLPPLVNLLGNYASNNGGVGGNNAGSSEHENSTDVLDGSGSNPNMCRGFRFSDPCLLNPSDNDSKQSGRNTPDRRPNAVPSDMENNKFFLALMEQINLLHETNSKICRNLHETKVDIEALKHAPTWGIRHRRDSLSGLSAHSQPMIFGGGFGTQSPAPTYHSGAYTPGSVTEVVREVKEAARVREDALLSRVKALVEERQWSLNEANLRMMRDIEELKSQINFLRSDRKETNKRITHLEAENKYMRQLLASIYNSNRNMQQQNKSTTPGGSSRGKHLQNTNAHRKQAFNLNYGTIHHQATSSLSVEEQDEEEPLHIIEPPVLTQTERKQQQQQQKQQQSKNDMRSSFSSSDGGSNGHISFDNNSLNKLAMSPPNFALITTTSPAHEQTAPQMQHQHLQQHQQPLQKPKRKNKENVLKKLSSDETLQQELFRRPSTDSTKTLTTQDLQRELNDAVAARQNAESRIIAIEKLVQNLHVNSIQPSSASFGVVGDGATGNYYNLSTSQMHHHLNSQQQPIQLETAQNANNNSKDRPHTTTNNNSAKSTNPNLSNTALNSTPKLSVAGPITDL